MIEMSSTECKECGKKFDLKDALEQHMKDKHTQATHSKVTLKFDAGKSVKYLVIVLIVAGIGYLVYGALTGEYSNVGAVGSTHIHADLSIYFGGEEFTPLPSKYFVKISQVHVEHGPGAGYVIHIHAIGVPLGMFFDSLGMKFSKDCFKIDTGENYCNLETRTLKMYVKHANGDWEQNNQFEKYVFQELDKILITYGNDSPEQMSQQQNSVTDFSKDNSG